MKRIVLVGNPNVGKSLIFNLLTGRYVMVSNYPGTTVEVSRGNAKFQGIKWEILDTPGINSLLPHSEDERVTRDILMEDADQVVIQVGDAKNLRRTLFISLQLAEMGIPFMLVLNMDDEAKSRGIRIDIKRLSEKLGVDVVSTTATRRKGIDNLIKKIPAIRKASIDNHYDPYFEDGIEEVEDLLPQDNISKRSIALMLLSGDETLKKWLLSHVSDKNIEKIEEIRHRIQARYSEPIFFLLNKWRIEIVDNLVKDVLFQRPVPKSSIRDTLGSWTMHPVWGLFWVIGVMILMYEFVGVFGAGTLVSLMEEGLFERVINPWIKEVVRGFIPIPFVQDLLVGPYGIFTMAITYSIAIILPIVGTFFIAFGILEDSGYMPRLAVMVNKGFRIIGLSGKAVLPMILGLGCDTMATLTTRILDTRKERLIVTLLLALGVPCSAQLGVILGMLTRLSIWALIIWIGTILFVMGLVGYLASKLVGGEGSQFIIEIPPLRIPKVSNIFIKTVARIEWYIKEAVPLFILGTLILFLMDKMAILGIVERISSPVVVKFLNLPPKATEAFLIGFLRRDYGAAGLFDLARDGVMDQVAIVVSMVTITLFVPCIANFFMIVKERGLKTAIIIVLFIFPFAFLVGGVLNLLLRTFGIAL
jgi:ferrous iron transport protein B